MTTQREALNLIYKLGLCDAIGHVQSCGYDENGTCSCSTLPDRLAEHIAAAKVEGREEALMEAENHLRRSMDEPWGDRAANRVWGLRLAKAERDATTTTTTEGDNT